MMTEAQKAVLVHRINTLAVPVKLEPFHPMRAVVTVIEYQNAMVDTVKELRSIVLALVADATDTKVVVK